MGRLGVGSGAILAGLLGALCAHFVAACDPPTLPATGERYVIAFEQDAPGAPTAWRGEHRRALSALTTILASTGDTWAFGETGAHLTLRTFDSGPGCPHGGGAYEPGAAYVWVDYACAHDDAQLRVIAAHEVLHFLEHRRHRTVHHLCAREGDAPDCFPGVSGEGVLNPWLPGEYDPSGDPLGPVVPALTAGDLRVIGPR